MTDEECKELEQVDKEEVKEEKKEQGKRDLKIVITSIVCTVLFIIIILLLVLLGLKKCNNDNSNSSSSSGSSSSTKYDYDSGLLNDKFKAIVKGYMEGPGGLASDNINEVKAISYIDNYNDGYFSLNISAISNSNKLYVYKAYKVYYPEDKSKFDNLISYLLLDSTPDVFIDGDPLETEFSCDSFVPTEEKITTDKVCKYVISNHTSNDNKYIDGYYYENNQYYVYLHQEYSASINPFTKQADMVINIDHPLYGYYQSLNK